MSVSVIHSVLMCWFHHCLCLSICVFCICDFFWYDLLYCLSLWLCFLCVFCLCCLQLLSLCLSCICPSLKIKWKFQYAKYNVQGTMWGMQYAKCNVKSRMSKVQCAECNGWGRVSVQPFLCVIRGMIALPRQRSSWTLNTLPDLGIFQVWRLSLYIGTASESNWPLCLVS